MKRPLSVTLTAWLFILAGIVGIAHHTSDVDPMRPMAQGAMWVLFVRLLAIVGGAFALRGANWARWLLVAWLAYHVVLSAMHDVSEAIAHAVLLAVVTYGLFYPAASAYFRRTAR